ncbi:GNAT family N-acetyltransferase [Blastococcus haudaquaticus]|uniref:Diamine N-acetyltransferase n=1 Tax=Blastococcus haudaquaticus TaxID=1938745 RepID=A0A286GL97_9ACTN|nr:GNAT family N-acetyltransferase [Blastococcus haudaquaticus]SOD95754.1 diamine N-acetyltransferase [Blastococcus haudaquaticus]
MIRLEPVTPENVRAVCDLRVAPAQEDFVRPNAVSLAEAYVHEVAWCRAVYDGDELVGFVMLHDTRAGPGYMLWRLMVDARFQGRGYGRQVVEEVIRYVRTRPGATQLKVGAHRGDGAPGPFYESLGFVATGEVIGGEEDVYALRLG